jgi:hypothetical protein
VGRFLFVVACALSLVGCAAITKGTTQVVAVDTPGVPAATCTIQTQNGPQIVTTPGSVTLTKGSAALPISCTKECYLPGSGVIASNTEAMAAGNVVFGGIIGLGVDAATGAMNKYADQVTVAMIPDQSCRRGEPPPPAHIFAVIGRRRAGAAAARNNWEQKNVDAPAFRFFQIL